MHPYYTYYSTIRRILWNLLFNTGCRKHQQRPYRTKILPQIQIQVQIQIQTQVQYQIGIRSAAGPRWLEADCKHCTSVSLANYHSQYFVPCTFKKLQLSRNTVHLETAPINSLCIFFLKICTSPNLIHSVHRSNNNSASQSLVSRTAQTYSA